MGLPTEVGIQASKGAGDTKDASDPCPICYEPFVSTAVTTKLPCGHRYHNQCIKKWLGKKNSCPTCRSSLRRDDLWPLYLSSQLHLLDEAERRFGHVSRGTTHSQSMRVWES